MPESRRTSARPTDRSPALLGIALASALSGCVSYYGEVQGHPKCKKIAVTSDAASLKGIEDLTVHWADPKHAYIILSATERRAWMKAEGKSCTASSAMADGVFVVSLAQIEQGFAGAPVDAARLAPRIVEGRELHPHGIGLHSGPEGSRLFIVDHPCEEGRPVYATRVLIGDLADGLSGPAFHFVRAIKVEGSDGEAGPFCAGNDIAPTGKANFFLSHDSGNGCSQFWDGLDQLLGSAGHHLLYHDGAAFRAVADDFRYINGLAYAERERRLYVAGTRRADIKVFDVDRLLNGDDAPIDTITVAPGLDNLEWDDEGRLTSGGHPDAFRFALYGKLATGLVKTSPTAIVEIDPHTYGHELLAADDGEIFSAASAAARVGEFVVAGAVFDDGLFVCRLDSVRRATGG